MELVSAQPRVRSARRIPHRSRSALLESAALGLRRLLWCDVVEVQNRVKQHPELADILPSVARIRREHQHLAFAYRNVDNRGAIANLVGALHETAHHALIASRKAHQHLLLAIPGRHCQKWPAGPSHRYGLVGVTVEDWIR